MALKSQPAHGIVPDCCQADLVSEQVSNVVHLVQDHSWPAAPAANLSHIRTISADSLRLRNFQSQELPVKLRGTVRG